VNGNSASRVAANQALHDSGCLVPDERREQPVEQQGTDKPRGQLRRWPPANVSRAKVRRVRRRNAL